MSQDGQAVLVVDDDDDIREIIGIILDGEGIPSIGAKDGVAALELMRQRGRPSLILLDLMMPRLDGMGFVRELRKDPSIADVPVVVMSGNSETGNAAALMGAASSLRKPVDLDELLEKVGRWARWKA